MDLESFMNVNGSTSRAVDLMQLGPASQMVYARVRNEGRTRTLIAGAFWRAFISSNAYLRALMLLGASSLSYSAARLLLAPQQHTGRFDLLVLDPGLPPAMPPRALGVDRQVFPVSDVFRGAKLAEQIGVPADLLNFSDVVAEAAFQASQFNIVLAPHPPTESLAVPDPALTVDDLAGSKSTAGVRVRCNRRPGLDGVTAAYHGLARGTGVVTVDGLTGSVVRTDRLTDSAFVEVPGLGAQVSTPSAGVMKGTLPRGLQRADFIGITSRRLPTTITGFNPELPNPSPNRQALIYTARDAQPGDSGAALVTDDGYLVGFAFERTLPGAQPEHCSWMWAQSVLDALDVSLI